MRVVAGPKAVGQMIPRLTRKAFERFGFPAATLLTDWEAIAGRDLARSTAPERLKWPKPAEEGAEGGGPRGGATLVLRVDGPRSIEVQMRARQIVERVNAYFGFRAVTDLRVVQAPVAHREEPRSCRPRTEPCGPAVEIAGIADAGLRAALERLGRGVAGSRGRA